MIITPILHQKADASRIYGLELEEILSPNRINFLLYKDTFNRRTYSGNPRDVFIDQHLENCNPFRKSTNC